MVLVEIGTAAVISAYSSWHFTSGYSLDVSDPIEGQPVQLSYYLRVFGCGLVFWLLVLLWARLHDSGDRQADIRKVARLAKLIAPITALNLSSCLQGFMKLPLLVRFLVLFQVSSNLALLLIWAFLSLKECMILRDAHTQQQQKSSPEPHTQQQQDFFMKEFMELFALDVDGVGGKVDKAGGSGKGHSSGASGRDENRGRYGGNDGEGGAYGGGDRGASGSGHGSGASGRGGGSEGGDRGRDGGGDRGASGSGHGSGASGSGGGSEGGDRGRDGGGADLERGGRGTSTEQAFKRSKITKMSLVLSAQAAGTLVGFHSTPFPSSSVKALLNVTLMDLLVAYLCGVTSVLLSSNEPEDSKAAKICANIGFICTVLGFILMVSMFLSWHLVSIAVLLFGVFWLILFQNGYGIT